MHLQIASHANGLKPPDLHIDIVLLQEQAFEANSLPR